MWNSVGFVLAVITVSVAQPPPECMTPPSIMNPEICCPSAPKLVATQIIDDCTKTGPLSCETSNCILRKGNFLTADGKVDKAALRKYAVPAEWTSTVNSGLEACFSEMNGASCESMKLVGCMGFYMINNCPANVWKSSAECEAFKTFANKCRPPGL